MSKAYEFDAAHLQLVVLEVWRDALAKPGLSPDDDFFGCGGHSMLALKICFQLEEEVGIEVPIDWLFEHTTVRGLASRIGGVLEEELPAV